MTLDDAISELLIDPEDDASPERISHAISWNDALRSLREKVNEGELTPAMLLMKLSLAESDIQFAKAKCCQAELSQKMGFGDYGQQMTLAKEAIDRAATHLQGVLEGD